LKKEIEEIYLAGGCLWGVQEFVRHIPGVVSTEAGRANGSSQSLTGHYDGYVECVMVFFNTDILSVARLMEYLFEIINPYSIDRQGPDIGKRYRTGVYSREDTHLVEAREFIESREDALKIAVEILPLTNYLKSEDKHQEHLKNFPEDACHLPKEILHKYRGIK
tara:strand:+ start:1800 stop:2291 length:492 start_codon:yes stop_codon:yes gene_type:complete